VLKANIEININLDILLSQIVRVLSSSFKIGKYGYDGEELFIHVHEKGDIKIKFRMVSYHNAYLGVWIKDVIYSHFDLPGGGIGFVMGMFRKYIEQEFPGVSIKMDGRTIYLENVQTNDIKINGTQLVGHLLYKDF
jgi:hypothetical protein